MKQFNRSEFFNTLVDTLPGDTKEKKAPFKEFYNKTLPKFSSRSSTGLNQYTGTFGSEELAHLLRRSLFGLTKADMDHFKDKPLDEVVTALLTQSPTPAPPLNAYSTSDPDAAFGTTWVNAGVDFTGALNVGRMLSFKEWWIGLMINQDRSLTEKMTLFWHNHFATESNIIQESRFVYKHHALLRSHALGNFKTLTRQVTTDPGMLEYLNGHTNTKGSPNENYARELQELFTVGKGPDSLYTEDDVKAAAHVLTGWKHNILSKPLADATFDATKHDTGDKTFSAFYNNKVISGISGANGATETDQLIDMLFENTETAKHLCRKLYRWFIYYVIDQQVEDDIITPLADLLRTSNYDMAPVLAKLLKSEHFFDNLNRGCHIKNPVDHAVGMARQFNIVFPDSADLEKQYTGWLIMYYLLGLLNMEPGDPPNVAGWPAYYQEPAFHELWINSNTLPYRNQMVDLLTSLGGVSAQGVTLKIDVLAFAKQFAKPGDPNQLIADSAALLSPNPLGNNETAFLKSTLLSGQTEDHYWSDAWAQHINNPGNTNFKQTVLDRLTPVYVYILKLAEYQLI